MTEQTKKRLVTIDDETWEVRSKNVWTAMFGKGEVRGEVSWLQSATSPRDATKSYTLVLQVKVVILQCKK